MSRPLRFDEQVTHAYAAIEYLLHNRSSSDIAEELGVSRFMVGRMVRRAKLDGLVEIRARLSDPIDVALSGALTQRFALTSAFAVVCALDEPEHVRVELAKVAAKVVPESIEKGDVVGLAAGRTILEMSRRITALPHCEIVQLHGAATTDSNEALRAGFTLGSIARGKLHTLYAPLLTSDAAAARMITSQPAIRQALKKMQTINTAVLSIGGWPANSLLLEQLKAHRESDAFLKKWNVVAEMGTTLLDADGNDLAALDGRTIGISTDQLRKVPLKIVVGGGSEKQAAILAALRANLVDVLITDAATADYCLANR